MPKLGIIPFGNFTWPGYIFTQLEDSVWIFLSAVLEA